MVKYQLTPIFFFANYQLTANPLSTTATLGTEESGRCRQVLNKSQWLSLHQAVKLDLRAVKFYLTKKYSKKISKKKTSSNFTLHLVKVGKLKRFKKVSSVLKTNKTDFANLRFLSFEKSMSINLNCVAWENRLSKKDRLCVKLS